MRRRWSGAQQRPLKRRQPWPRRRERLLLLSRAWAGPSGTWEARPRSSSPGSHGGRGCWDVGCHGWSRRSGNGGTGEEDSIFSRGAHVFSCLKKARDSITSHFWPCVSALASRMGRTDRSGKGRACRRPTRQWLRHEVQKKRFGILSGLPLFPCRLAVRLLWFHACGGCKVSRVGG